MPFYTADFFRDQNVILMNNREIGCYMKLIAQCWDHGHIPDDIGQIAKLCNESKEDMAQLWQSMKMCFKKVKKSDGKLMNTRVFMERKKLNNRAKERSESGKKGAKSRWYDKRKSYGSAIDLPLAEPMAKNGYTYSYSNIKKTKPIGLVKKSSKRVSSEFPDDFNLNGGHLQLAAEFGHNAEEEFSKFRDWAMAHGTKYKNWDHAFRNWIRNAEKFKTANKGTGYERRKTGRDYIFEGMDGKRWSTIPEGYEEKTLDELSELERNGMD
jgi:hypothetical protein